MSEALRLAHELILAMRDTDEEHWDALEEAAAELRRLHAALAEPEQKPVAWAGLTDEEIIDVLHPLVMADMSDEATDYEIARAIEAKLKEKNT